MNQGPRRLPRLIALRTHDPPAGGADTDLLARWVVHRDEVAFELIVRRHAPTVLAACRRVLADANDADDAFQAVFLVLARKAASVARGEVLGAWLHRVACRAALRVRAERAKRLELQRPGDIEYLPAPPATDPAWSELLRVLDEEIERLPARHRVAFVLCGLEGKTCEEAGRLLGCPAGTVSSRLARARQRLRDRLTRRGFAPAGLLVAALTGDALAATVPTVLVESIVRAAPSMLVARASGVSPDRPTAIAQGVVRAMFVQKLRFVPALIVVGLPMAAGAVFAGSGRVGDAEPPRPEPKGAGEKEPPAQKQPGALVVRFKVVQPQPGGVNLIQRHDSIAEAGRHVHLLPAATGLIKRVEVDIGDPVKAGQLLAQIDARGTGPSTCARAAIVGVEQADGLLKEAEARVAIAKAEVGAAKGTVKLREVEAIGAKAPLEFQKKNVEIMNRAFKNGTGSESALAEAEGQYRAGQAHADAAALGVENARGELMVKEAKLVQAEAERPDDGEGQYRVHAKVGLEKASWRLQPDRDRRTPVRRGRGGARLHCQPGDFVRPGERADPTPLFTVLRADVLRLVVWIPEGFIGRVEPGQAVEVAFGFSSQVVGKVARVGVAVEQPLQVVRVEIDVPNPKGTSGRGRRRRWRSNSGKVQAGTLRVPAEAVVAGEEKEGGTYLAVYVYKDGKARLTRVQLGFGDEKEIEVVSGLTPKDLVVADPKDLAPKPEVPIEVEKPAQPK